MKKIFLGCLIILVSACSQSLGAPEILGPSAGEKVNDGRSMEFSWRIVPGADDYSMEIIHSEESSGTINIRSVLGQAKGMGGKRENYSEREGIVRFLWMDQLPDKRVISWRVRALRKDQWGNSHHGEWSPSETFLLDRTWGTPQWSFQEASRIYENTGHAYLQWTEVEGAFLYRLIISLEGGKQIHEVTSEETETVLDFSDLPLDVSQQEYRLTVTLRAENRFGRRSPASEAFTMHIQGVLIKKEIYPNSLSSLKWERGITLEETPFYWSDDELVPRGTLPKGTVVTPEPDSPVAYQTSQGYYYPLRIGSDGLHDLWVNSRDLIFESFQVGDTSFGYIQVPIPMGRDDGSLFPGIFLRIQFSQGAPLEIPLITFEEGRWGAFHSLNIEKIFLQDFDGDGIQEWAWMVEEHGGMLESEGSGTSGTYYFPQPLEWPADLHPHEALNLFLEKSLFFEKKESFWGHSGRETYHYEKRDTDGDGVVDRIKEITRLQDAEGTEGGDRVTTVYYRRSGPNPTDRFTPF